MKGQKGGGLRADHMCPSISICVTSILDQSLSSILSKFIVKTFLQKVVKQA